MTPMRYYHIYDRGLQLLTHFFSLLKPRKHFPCAVQIRCCGKTPIRIIVLRLGGNMNHYFSWILTGLIYFLLILHLYCGTKHFVMKHQVISPLWRRTKTCCNALPESDASVTCYTAHSIIFLH